MERIKQYVDDLGRTWSDDATIEDDERLLRRVPPWQIVWDDNLQKSRPSSAAFDDDSQGDPMSVYLTSILNQMGYTAAHTLDGHDPGFAVAAVSAGALRDEQQVVLRDPEPGAPPHICDPAHALVAGKKATKRRSRIGKRASWAVAPPQI